MTLVGVLALQGGFEAHERMLSRLGATVREVRVAGDLEGLDGLVIPGGESTTMTLGIDREGLADPLREMIAGGGSDDDGGSTGGGPGGGGPGGGGPGGGGPGGGGPGGGGPGGGGPGGGGPGGGGPEGGDSDGNGPAGGGAGGIPVLGSCAGMIMLDRDHLGLMDMVAQRNAFGRQLHSFEADLELRGLSGDPLRGVFIRAPWIAEHGPGVEILAEVDGHPVAARQDRMLVVAFHAELTDDDRVHRMFLETV
jgi:glutamine amidotransferase PdxT